MAFWRRLPWFAALGDRVPGDNGHPKPFGTVPDWYDKLLTLLGLDSIRNDHLLGVPLREFPPLEFQDGPGILTTALCRLPDGRTQIVFQVSASGDHWVGFLPCTPCNVPCLEQFLVRARSLGTGPVETGRRPRFPERILRMLRPVPVLIAMDPLPDRHRESSVEWALVLNSRGRKRLQFTLRGPRGFFRRQLDWTPDTTAYLTNMAAVARQMQSLDGDAPSAPP